MANTKLHNDTVIWEGNDGMTPEIKYLLENHNLTIDPDSSDAMYKINVDGKYYIYPEKTKLKFFNIVKEKGGTIKSLEFNVIVDKENIVMPYEWSTPEIRYLRTNEGLIVDNDNPVGMYKLRNKKQSYPDGSRIKFWNYVFDSKGNILSVRFKFEQLKWV